MLKAVNRLKSDSDFKKVKEKGKLFQSENFALAILDRGDTKDSRFGFVISTKISKSAVARNGIKRTLRAAVGDRLGKTKLGCDVVFLVKPSILQKKKEAVDLEVGKVMTNAKLLT